jgi:MFS family permease
MVAGTLGNVAGLLVLLLAGSYPVLLLGYLLVQVFNNAAGAAFNGIVPDVVPEAEFGKASGMLGAMVQLGSVGGLAATLAMAGLGHIQWTFAVIAAVVALSLLPTLWAASGEGTRPLARPPRASLAGWLRELLAPLRGGDFAWVVLTRSMVTAGVYCILPYLLFFFRDVVKAPHPADFTARWELLLLLAATPFGLAGGWVSDRLGRKAFVYASGALQGLVVAVFIAFYPTQASLVLLLGAVYGVGYGLYYAVDWALACDTLPDRDRAAKDMGLFHVAFTLPQVVVPVLAGLSLDALNRQAPTSGYRAVFAAAIAFFALGTVLVSRIRSVR